MKILLIIILLLPTMGCSGFGKKMKSFLRGESPAAAQQKRRRRTKKFSDSPNHIHGSRRKYKRTTRAKLESDSQLSDSSGSLWVMEGQGAYLFSQNIMRMIGDPLAIRMEGEPREQLESKVKIIADLMNRLNKRRRKAARRVARAEAKKKKENADKEKSKKTDAKSSDDKDKKVAKENVDSNFPVKTIPTRIIERLVDGNYRVKGTQPFMIGNREYNVIVTGIVRAGDFAEEGISARKLLDPKFDIVSKRRKDKRL